MKYQIIDIADEDFGCEGRPDNQPVCCELIVEANGIRNKIRMEEYKVIERHLEPGMEIELSDFRGV